MKFYLFSTMLVFIFSCNYTSQNQKMKELQQEQKLKEVVDSSKITGIWKVNYFVDEFGDQTKEKYITNKNYIVGKFSNTATENSTLYVDFIVKHADNIAIQLYEYGGNNPVKAASTWYKVLIKDEDGNISNAKAVNYSDRLSFNKSGSNIMHKLFMKGEIVKFKIIEEKRPSTNYSFTIKNPDWYKNAYSKLREF